MSPYCRQSFILSFTVLVFGISGCSGLALNPVHMGKFIFQGKVVDESGVPIPGAWVKVRGWETLTDAQGRWRQEQVVDCGAMREHMGSYDENDEILVEARGYESSTKNFVVRHPAYFGSCDPDQTVAFDMILKTKKNQARPNEVTL